VLVASVLDAFVLDEALNTSLVTADVRLARAARGNARCVVSVVT